VQRSGKHHGGAHGGRGDRGHPVLALDADVEQAHPEGHRHGQPGQEQRDRPVEDDDDGLGLLRGGVTQVDHDLEGRDRVLADQRDDDPRDDERDDDRQHRADQRQPDAAEKSRPAVHAAPAAVRAPVM
jgi:hypothetical protein